MAKTKRQRTALTDEERAARRERDRKRMRQAVERLRTSDGWTGWLRARQRFHRYSMTNLLLILSQAPDATYVAGFRRWLDLGYCVRKGSTAIWIWTPIPPTKKALAEWRAAGADPDEKPRTRFSMRPKVFDVADVDPLPPPAVPAPLEPPISPIAGDDKAHLLGALIALAAEHNCPLKVLDGALPNGADGVLDLKANDGAGEIRIAGSLSGNGRLATAAHEVAHLLVRRELQAQAEQPKDAVKLSYAEEEIVVEAVTFTVCTTIGLDTSANSVGYIGFWAEQAPLATLEHCAETIDALARRIEDALLGGEPAWEPAAPADVSGASSDAELVA